MKRYNSYLENVLSDIGIPKGLKESENSFYLRLLYSSICRLAYASLFDKADDGIAVSVEYFKSRINDTIEAYKAMYPELVSEIDPDFCDAIFYLFEAGGLLYHSPKRVSPPKLSRCKMEKVCLLRGQSLSESVKMSGAMSFTNTKLITSKDNIFRFFLINDMNMEELWNKIVSKAVWGKYEGSESNLEYLRTIKFYYGYWSKEKISDGTISIARNKENILSKLYYLYKIEDGILFVSQISTALVSEQAYRDLTNANLYFIDTLPKIMYYDDGAIVHTKLKYLLPKAETVMYLICSFPCSFSDVKDTLSSKRIFDKNIFEVFRTTLEHKGYKFEEDKTYDKWS